MDFIFGKNKLRICLYTLLFNLLAASKSQL